MTDFINLYYFEIHYQEDNGKRIIEIQAESKEQATEHAKYLYEGELIEVSYIGTEHPYGL